MHDFFNELRMWRAEEARRRVLSQGEIVSNEGVRAMNKRRPVTAWGVCECVGEPTFRRHGGQLLFLSRVGQGRWACRSRAELQTLSKGETAQMVSFLENTKLLMSLRRSGLTAKEISQTLDLPLAAVEVLTHPHRIGLLDEAAFYGDGDQETSCSSQASASE